MRTRRDFLKLAPLASVAFAPIGCAGVRIVDSRPRDGAFLSLSLGLEDGVRAAFTALDTSWLEPGDSVFVKVACNSGNRHPAVTSPNAVRAVTRALFERGAGRVLVGDQSGV